MSPLTRPADDRHDQPHPQVVPCSWQHGGPITLASDSVAIISAVLNFMWLPYYPVWSLLIIALDVFVIWALTVHGRDVAK